MSFKKISIVVILSLVVILLGVYNCEQENESLAYKSSINKAPSGAWLKFELQHDYPKEMPPESSKDEMKWLSTDVSFTRPVGEEGTWSKGWTDYAKHVKSYLVENIGIDTSTYTLKKKWYNLPWLASDPFTGREYSHGARYSFSIPLRQIDPTGNDKDQVSVWGVANYNNYGGYAIGQMWSKDGNLNYQSGENSNLLKGLPFPEGTVIHKINMIGNLGDNQATHLKGAPTWTLNLHKYPNTSDASKKNERSLQKAHLFEMDFMVKDHRSPTGWVFGALVYDENEDQNKPLWDRYKVMGLQFGLDPESFPAVSRENEKPVFQTLLKPISKNWSVGCNGRLATFQGTTNQNCIGCHQTASFVEGTSKDAQRGYGLTYGVNCSESDTTLYSFYFQNWKYPSKFSGKPTDPNGTIVGLDFSLRLYDVVKSYRKYRETKR